MKNFTLPGLAALSLFSTLALAADAGHVKFRVTLSPAGSFTAEAGTLSGSAQVDKAGVKCQGASLRLDDLKTGVDLRDEHMKKKYFETAKFPTAQLSAATGHDGHFEGKLNVHGVEKPIAGTYSVDGATLKAAFVAKMSDFQISKASYMGIGVKDDIDVEIELPVVSGSAK